MVAADPTVIPENRVSNTMNDEMTFDELAPWLAAAITVAGGILRLLLLGTKEMWLDETFSVWLASHSLPELLEWLVTIDQHPPLYYLLLHGWMARFGDSPYDVRLLSALFGAATIPFMYLTGKRLSNSMLGLAAAMLLAFSPYHIFYSQETRMYTLLTFNAAVATYALVRLLTDARAAQPIGRQLREVARAWRTPPAASETPKEFSYKAIALNQRGLRSWISRHTWSPIRSIETDLAWIAWVLFTLATMLTHNTALLFPFAANLFVLGLLLFRRLKPAAAAHTAFQAPSFSNWLIAQVAIVLLWSPWLGACLKQLAKVSDRFWIPAPTWDTVVGTLKALINASAPLPEAHARVLWGIYTAVALLALFHYRKKLSQLLLLVTLVAVPFLAELLVSLRRPIFLDRTLIWTMIPLFLLLAAGVAQLKQRFLFIFGMGVLALINFFSVGDYFRFYYKEDWYTPAGYVALFAEKGDLLLFNSNFVVVSFDYYFEEFEQQYRLEVERQGLPLDLYTDRVLEPEMTEADIPALLSIIEGRERVWLIYSHEHYTDPHGLIPQTLDSELELTRTRDFYGGVVRLYTAP